MTSSSCGSAEGSPVLATRDVRVLHAMALRELGRAEELAELLQESAEDVARALADAVAAGAAVRTADRYRTTPAGRAHLQHAYESLCAELRRDPRAVAAFEAFDQLNAELLEAVLDWQTVAVAGARVVNTHADERHDQRVLDRLHRVVTRTGTALSPLSTYDALAFALLDRMQEALELADAGDVRWVAALELDSVHTLWFRLHEHLLRLLGRERTLAG